MAVWSFQRMNMAFGFSENSGNRASGVPLASVRAGVLPVVSKAIPTTCSAVPAGHCARASFTVPSSTSI